MDQEKFQNLVLYILKNPSYQEGGIKKLNKLLYFIDFYFYKDHERLITDAKYAKAQMGPVVDDYKIVFEKIVSNGLMELSEKDLPYIEYLPKKNCDLSVFSSEEIKHVDAVLERYGKLTSAELEGISHEQQPWVLTENFGEIIDPDLALLIDDSPQDEVEIRDEKLKEELVDLASAV